PAEERGPVKSSIAKNQSKERHGRHVQSQHVGHEAGTQEGHRHSARREERRGQEGHRHSPAGCQEGRDEERGHSAAECQYGRDERRYAAEPESTIAAGWPRKARGATQERQSARTGASSRATSAADGSGQEEPAQAGGTAEEVRGTSQQSQPGRE